MPRAANTSPQTLALFELLLASGKSWRHGYDLAGECDLKSGTLYPLLIRLSDQGVLESRWEVDDVTHRPRHVYRLTAQGVSLAKTQLKNARKPAARGKLRVRNA
jgi:PadR family transcriptional regulator, regulatory protein PadR